MNMVLWKTTLVYANQNPNGIFQRGYQAKTENMQKWKRIFSAKTTEIHQVSKTL